MALGQADPEGRTQLSAFTQALAELGWIEGRTLQMDVRWSGGSIDRARIFARDLVGLRPDVVLADSTAQAAALYRETRAIPVVFVLVADPVGMGLIAGLPHPGGQLVCYLTRTTRVLTTGEKGGACAGAGMQLQSRQWLQRPGPPDAAGGDLRVTSHLPFQVHLQRISCSRDG
jgi:hypothetical protein